MERNVVVLVNEDDLAIGTMDKLEAHVKGKLHRAFSVFLFNDEGKMLIHQRAATKYHGAGLWTNACCSHPQKDEDVEKSALERLAFEMGLECDIHKLFSFIYNTPVENGLIEHELDHVFIGFTNAEPQPNREEVQNYRWIHPEELLQEMQEHPLRFTYWFRKSVGQVLGHARV